MKLKPITEPSVLARIVSRKLADVAQREAHRPLSSFERAIAPSDRDFFRAISEATQHPALIAELKIRSPSKGLLRSDWDIPQISRIYDKYAAAISVVTDEPFFHGSLTLLRDVRERVQRPVLCKDFIVSTYQIHEARAHSADAVLLMASLLPPDSIETLLALARSLHMEELVETHDDAELDEVLATSARIIGINNRNLATLAIDPDTFPRLASRIPGDRLRVAESGIDSPAYIDRLRDARADAVLIGTALIEASDIEERIRALGGLA